MAESARNVAKRTEDRLDEVAASAREKFDRMLKVGFLDQIRNGRFLDQVDHGVDQGRAETRSARTRSAGGRAAERGGGRGGRGGRRRT